MDSHPGSAKPVARWCIFLLGFTFWLALTPIANAEAAPSTAAPSHNGQVQPAARTIPEEPQRSAVENRFLIVVDASNGMSRVDKNLRQTLFTLVHSGISGCMQPGDTYGIWFFNSQTHTDYPMQVWDPARNSALATSAVEYLSKVGYKKRPKVGAFIHDLSVVIASVADVNVILLSDGSTPLEGTPFDAAINALYKAHFRDFRLARDIFITCLAARGGRLVSWSVNRPEDALKFVRVERAPTETPTTEASLQIGPVEQALAKAAEKPAVLASAAAQPAAPPAEPPAPARQNEPSPNPNSSPTPDVKPEIVSTPPDAYPISVPETSPDNPEDAFLPSLPSPPTPALDLVSVPRAGETDIPTPPSAAATRHPPVVEPPETPIESAIADPTPSNTDSLTDTILVAAPAEVPPEAPSPAQPSAASHERTASPNIARAVPFAALPVAAREPSAAPDPAALEFARVANPEPSQKEIAAVGPNPAGAWPAKTLFFLGLGFLAIGFAVLGIYVRLFHSGSSPSLISRSMQRK